MAEARSSSSQQEWRTDQSAQITLEKPSDTPRVQPRSQTGNSDVTVRNGSIRSFAPSTKRLNGRSKRRIGSSSVTNSTKSTAVQEIESRIQMDQKLSTAPARHYNVRTIPPWVRDADEDDVLLAAENEHLDTPRAALVAQHNTTPSTAQRRSSSRPGGNTTSSGAKRSDPTSRWISFARASAYPRENFDHEKVDLEWLNENYTDYSKPWLADIDDDPDNLQSKYRAFQNKRQAWYKRAQFTILRNPFVPLAFRFTILFFAAIAIGIGAAIFHEANNVQQCLFGAPNLRSPSCVSLVGTGEVNYYRDPSALMAIIVDTVSIVYTCYITYDEYFSKPLGLRPARAKVRLVLLDLFFIVFQAANLSLAFESTMLAEGACVAGTEAGTGLQVRAICSRAKALSAVLTVSLVAWLFTFSVSILRLVERINMR